MVDFWLQEEHFKWKGRKTQEEERYEASETHTETSLSSNSRYSSWTFWLAKNVFFFLFVRRAFICSASAPEDVSCLSCFYLMHSNEITIMMTAQINRGLGLPLLSLEKPSCRLQSLNLTSVSRKKTIQKFFFPALAF